MPSAAYTNSDGYISKVHRVDYNQTVVRGITCVSAVRSANNIPTKNKPSANRLVTTNPVVLKVFFISQSFFLSIPFPPTKITKSELQKCHTT